MAISIVQSRFSGSVQPEVIDTLFLALDKLREEQTNANHSTPWNPVIPRQPRTTADFADRTQARSAMPLT